MRGEDRQEDQQRDLPRHPGRPADARDRRQGGGLQEALSPEFKAYQQQVVKNAARWRRRWSERGLRIVSGRTESHVMLVDLRPKGLTGKEAEAILGSAHHLQQERHPERPRNTDDHQRHPPRLAGDDHARLQRRKRRPLTANLIADVLDKPHDEANIAAVRAKVAALTKRLPVYR